MHVAGASCSPRAVTNAGSWSWTHHGDGAEVGVTVGAAVTARGLPQHVALQMRRTSSPEQSSSCCALAHRSGLPVSTSSAPAFTSWVLHHSAVVTGLAVGSADGMSVGAEVGAELGSDVAGPHRVRTPWQYELAGSPEQSSVGLGVGDGVGLGVGVAVEAGVGFAVGSLVGLFIGLAVGSLDPSARTAAAIMLHSTVTSTMLALARWGRDAPTGSLHQKLQVARHRGKRG